jgi:PAS domain S-box-containing protein
MTDAPLDSEQARLLLDSITDHAIYMLDVKGRVMSWNPAAERIKGYRAAEVKGQLFHRFFTPEDRAAGLPDAILARALEVGGTEEEGWRVRKDGTRFWALATVQPVRDRSGALIGFAKITRDMTERRAAELALLESERRFRFLVEGVIDYAIYMLDVNGMVSNWNRGAERIKGYAADEVVGRHFSLFYTPEDRQVGLPARALARALREGKFSAEGWRVRKDGSRFWASVVIDPIYDDDGRHIGYAKITRDVTERRQAEQALAHSERQFRLLMAGVVDYALYMLDPNGLVTSWNAGAQQIKGYEAGEVIGRHFSMFYTDVDRQAGLPIRALQTAAAEGRFEAEGWRVRKDGSLFWASVVIDPIRDETGELVGYAKITRDITERRNAQLELQRAHDRLAQAQKMEAIGQLTGGVAHDFNNLLMVVGGQTQLLRKRLEADERSLRALDAIEVAARRGQDLTRHLLSFARRQRLRPAATDLPARRNAVRELLSATLGSQISLTLDLPEDLWPIYVDPSELELALLNMAVNARDAMPGGGMFEISARNATCVREVDELAGEYVVLTIADNGEGMAPDIQARVFEPFFTTKEVDKGTGLGLSQVYGFAQQSGGRVTLRSTLGQGTEITLYLPRSDALAPAASEAESFQQVEGVEILVVEDNPEVLDVAVGLLEQLGNQTRVVSSAAAALQTLRDGPLPDVLFSDIVMAGDMNGLDLARLVRKQHPNLPILLVTGYSEAATGVTDEFPILSKPYSLADLSRALGGLKLKPRERRAEARSEAHPARQEVDLA